MDPTVRVDTLSAIFGQLFMSISIYGCQQTFVQRYCSMSSEARLVPVVFLRGTGFSLVLRPLTKLALTPLMTPSGPD